MLESEKKICKNCINLFITGMLQSWGNTCGYCLLIMRENELTMTKKENKLLSAMMHMDETCPKFEIKNK